MTMRNLTIVAGAALILSACASTTTTAPETTASATTTASASEVNDSEIVLAASLADVKAAALSAMAESGFNIKEESDTMIRGNRPRKMGAFVGSGGEKMTITFRVISESSTAITVVNKKTFVGIAGQKNWTEPVLNSIQETLAR